MPKVITLVLKQVLHLEKEFLLPGKVYGSTFPQVSTDFHFINEADEPPTTFSLWYLWVTYYKKFLQRPMEWSEMPDGWDSLPRPFIKSNKKLSCFQPGLSRDTIPHQVCHPPPSDTTPKAGKLSAFRIGRGKGEHQVTPLHMINSWKSVKNGMFDLWSSLAGAGGSTRNLVFAFASDVKSIFSEWFYRFMKWKRGRTIFDICSAIEQPQPISYFLLFLSFLSRVSRAIACCTASPPGLLPPTGASGSQLHLGPTNILPLLLLGHLHHLLLGPQQTASLPPGHLHQVAQLGPPLLHLRQGAGGALAHHAFGRRASGLFSFEFNCCWLCGKLQMW